MNEEAMARVGPQRQNPKHLCPSSKVVVDNNLVRSKCVGRRHVTGLILIAQFVA